MLPLLLWLNGFDPILCNYTATELLKFMEGGFVVSQDLFGVTNLQGYHFLGRRWYLRNSLRDVLTVGYTKSRIVG